MDFEGKGRYRIVNSPLLKPRARSDVDEEAKVSKFRFDYLLQADCFATRPVPPLKYY